MKKQGVRNSYAKELETEIMNLYRQEVERQIRVNGRVQEDLIFINMSKASVSRFYTSEQYAITACKQMMKGKELNVRPLRKEMYRQIMARVLKLKARYEQANPSVKKTIPQLVSEAIRLRAPCLYMTPGSLRYKIFKIRKCKKK